MKCIILAAGYGTRLYPLTKNTAKPLVEVNNVPIITRIVENVSHLPIETYYVVTNDKYADDLQRWADSLDTDLDIVVVNDGTKTNEDRLGTLGDINYVVQEENVEDDVLIIGGDNLFGFDLEELVDFFEEHNESSVLAAKDMESKDVVANSFGVLEVEGEKAVGFEEKPSKPKSTLASTLLYVVKKEHLPHVQHCVEELGHADDAGLFFEYLVEEEPVHVYTFTEEWFDIGTKERLREAEKHYDDNA